MVDIHAHNLLGQSKVQWEIELGEEGNVPGVFLALWSRFLNFVAGRSATTLGVFFTAVRAYSLGPPSSALVTARGLGLLLFVFEVNLELFSRVVLALALFTTSGASEFCGCVFYVLWLPPALRIVARWCLHFVSDGSLVLGAHAVSATMRCLRQASVLHWISGVAVPPTSSGAADSLAVFGALDITVVGAVAPSLLVPLRGLPLLSVRSSSARGLLGSRWGFRTLQVRWRDAAVELKAPDAAVGGVCVWRGRKRISSLQVRDLYLLAARALLRLGGGQRLGAG